MSDGAMLGLAVLLTLAVFAIGFISVAAWRLLHDDDEGTDIL